VSPQVQTDIELMTEVDVHELYSSRGSLTSSKTSGGLNFGQVEYIVFCYYFADRVLAPYKSSIYGTLKRRKPLKNLLESSV
jgi:hypothetical protein